MGRRHDGPDDCLRSSLSFEITLVQASNLKGVRIICGLSGAAGSIIYNDEKVCHDLLWYNTLRGVDATGIGTVPRNEKSRWKIAKAPTSADMFMEMKRYTEALQGQHRVILQHNRKATGGGKGEGFAHPWDFTHILGAHNGSIQGSDLRGVPGAENALLDSHGLLNAIDLHGPVETFKNLTHYPDGEFSNAWALTWFDKADGTVNFLRNWKRPLHLLFNDRHTVMYWSSEIGHLKSATSRNGVKRAEDEKIFSVPLDAWVKFTIPSYDKPFEKPLIRKITYKEPKTYSVSEGGSGHYPFPSARETTTSDTASGTKSLFKEDRDQSPFRSAASAAVHPAATSSINHKNYGRLSGEKLGAEAIRDENLRKTLYGKDRFVLVYQSDDVRIYFEANSGVFYRYWWDRHDVQWHGTRITGVPSEIPVNYSIADHIKEKRLPLDDETGRPIVYRKVPDSAPKIDLNQEMVRRSGRNLVVTKLKKSGHWRAYTWNFDKGCWEVSTSFAAPTILPDTLYDVDACHHFKISGKHDKRKVRYKGFDGKLLTMTEFNTATSHGCLVCGRTPTWIDGKRGGVRVNFVNKSHEFLCEFCGESSDLLQSVLASGKTSEKLLLEQNKRRMN